MSAVRYRQAGAPLAQGATGRLHTAIIQTHTAPHHPQSHKCTSLAYFRPGQLHAGRPHSVPCSRHSRMKAAQLSVLAALSALAAKASAFAPGTASRQGMASRTLDWVSHPQIARAYSRPRPAGTAERGELFTDTARQAPRAGMAEECSTAALRGSVVFLYSDDVARSRQFWGADLGLPLVADKESVVFFKLPHAGGSLAVVKQGVSAAATPPVCARDAGKDVVMVCLLTDDVDGWSARLEGAGHHLDQPPRQNERFGIKNALLRSPEGYLVEIQQFLDPAEQALFTT